MTAMTPLKQNQCEAVPQHSDHDQNQMSHEFPKRVDVAQAIVLRLLKILVR